MSITTFLIATFAMSAAAASPSVGVATVLELDAAKGRAVLVLEEHDGGANKTDRLVRSFERGAQVGEATVVCSYAADADAATVTACRSRAVPSKGAKLDVVSTATRGQTTEQRGHVGDVDVTLRTAFAATSSSWPDDSRPPAAATGGNGASVELVAGTGATARMLARVVVPFSDSEGMSWDDVGAAVACRADAPRTAACLLIAVVSGNNANVDLTDVRVIVSAPFDLGAPPTDSAPLKAACVNAAGGPKAAKQTIVSVVADAELVVTVGARVADALAKAGCSVRNVAPSKAKRNGASVVYFTAPYAAATTSIAGAFGATTKPLTWKSPAHVVVAVGR